MNYLYPIKIQWNCPFVFYPATGGATVAILGIEQDDYWERWSPEDGRAVRLAWIDPIPVDQDREQDDERMSDFLWDLTSAQQPHCGGF